MAASATTVPGVKIAATPMSFSAWKSSGGITPPTTIMMSGAAQLGQLGLQLGHQGQVAGGQRAGAHHVDAVGHRLGGGLGRGLEEVADLDVEAEVGEAGGDHLLAAVVAVLAHLGDQDAGLAAVGLGEGLDHRLGARGRRA